MSWDRLICPHACSEHVPHLCLFLAQGNCATCLPQQDALLTTITTRKVVLSCFSILLRRSKLTTFINLADRQSLPVAMTLMASRLKEGSHLWKASSSEKNEDRKWRELKKFFLYLNGLKLTATFQKQLTPLIQHFLKSLLSAIQSLTVFIPPAHIIWNVFLWKLRIALHLLFFTWVPQRTSQPALYLR